MEEKTWINLIDCNENFKKSSEQLEKERQEDEHAKEIYNYGSSEFSYFTHKDFEVQGTIYPDEPLKEYFLCKHCEKRVPLRNFKGHIEETCKKLQEEDVFPYGSTLDGRTVTSEQSVESNSDVGDSDASDSESAFATCFSIDGETTAEGSVVSDETPSSKPKLRNRLLKTRRNGHPYFRPFVFGSPAVKYQILSKGRSAERVMLYWFLLQKSKYVLPSVEPLSSLNERSCLKFNSHDCSTLDARDSPKLNAQELSQNQSKVERPTPDSLNEMTAELPTSSPYNCAPSNSSSNSNSSYKSSVYYPHIHCGVKTSHQPCKYFMTSCPVHGGKRMPERSFKEDSQKLKSALFKLQKIMEDEDKTKEEKFNIRIHCGVSTSEEEGQHKCMEFVLTCEHPVEKKAEVRKHNGINYVKFIQDFIQDLIDVDPSLDHLNPKHCCNNKIVNNHVPGASEEIVHDTTGKFDRTTCSPAACFPTAGQDHHHHSDRFNDFLLTAGVPPNKQSSAKNLPEEPYDSGKDSSTINGPFSYSCMSQVSKDGRYTLQRIEPDYSETKNMDPFWQEFERAVKEKLKHHLQIISTSKS